MEMLQLRYFYEVAKSGSITKTAQKYMVPASSVSSSIGRLENELGVKLFDRTSNRIRLNEKGNQFFRSATSFLSELDNAVGAVCFEGNDDRKITILVKAMRETILQHVISFNAVYPQVQFKFDLNSNETDYKNYDIIIDEKSDYYNDYESFDLHTLRIRVEALSTNPICKKTLTLKELKDQPFITTDSDHESFYYFKKACLRNGFEPKVIIECNDYTCRDRCILKGLGLGTTLGNTTNSLLADVQYLDITDYNEKFVTRIYYKKQSYFGNVKQFIDFVKDKLK